MFAGASIIVASNDGLVEGSTFQIDDSEVVLYSDKVRATELLNILHDVNAERNVDGGYSTVSVFDSSWIGKMNETVATNAVLNSINDHAPTIVLDGGYFTESKIIKKISASSPTEQIHCAYMDYNGVTYEYSIGGKYSESEALELAYEWATNTAKQAGQESEYDGADVDSISSSPQSVTPHWSLIAILNYSEPLVSDRGSFAIRIEVSQLMDFNDTEKDYFQLHYYLYGTANTDGGYRLSDIQMSYGLPNGTNLCGHGPSNTSGTSGSSVGVSLGGGGSSSGPSINVGVSGSWSYSIADVVVYNESEIVNNSVMITHDIDENKNVGKAYIAEPGVMLSVDREIDSSYISYTHMENYNIHTCHHEENLFGLINDNTDYYVHWLPYYVTVYNGHSEGSFVTRR